MIWSGTPSHSIQSPSMQSSGITKSMTRRCWLSWGCWRSGGTFLKVKNTRWRSGSTTRILSTSWLWRNSIADRPASPSTFQGLILSCTTVLGRAWASAIPFCNVQTTALAQRTTVTWPFFTLNSLQFAHLKALQWRAQNEIYYRTFTRGLRVARMKTQWYWWWRNWRSQRGRPFEAWNG